MNVPIHYQPHQSNDDPSGMSIICIISWTIGVMVTVGFIVMFAKCLMVRRCPPCPPPTTSGPSRQGPLYREPRYPLYPERIGIAPPGPPPPREYESDLEQGSIDERAVGTTNSSKVGNQPRVPPPPYCRRC
ncbi:uncharacterized protein FFB20_08089 [Fusarium fujikuroi]|uniref:Uncharacterized protein n=2 Tax=Fusarium fujikuroi TaxID=5127 RepID=S0E8D8_GIBF5|nr:uncharacterized protein FFUJ_08806 [Fusarium fujikuroi IMI 58289]KLP10453.1 uncharacterized protein Y057_3657 [Fusarium fujikuroi]KLP19640.1 uncharacterized protein LW94_15230 [Fusarium fujikuroi]CCT71146.1 uncharacterized protein FFUJ_08806 [Fusarium fujikuroi IMI 58289]SCN87789.1 uncharacterized protein FFB20_08089 [Fusarium fujikuroi]SCN95924.1 uncharacterized protein FFE2_08357 [Fusarium fujikuroi]